MRSDSKSFHRFAEVIRQRDELRAALEELVKTTADLVWPGEGVTPQQTAHTKACEVLARAKRAP